MSMRYEVAGYLLTHFAEAGCYYCARFHERSEKTPCPGCSGVTRDYAQSCGNWGLSEERAAEMSAHILKILMLDDAI